jgi:hypothetical protein
MSLPFGSQYFNGSAGIDQGGWIMQATELRCAMSMNYDGETIMLYGGGQWGAPSGAGPWGQGEGAQIYAQYSPPNGPLAIECQMTGFDTAVQALVSAQFGTVWLACAGVANSQGNARVFTRWDVTNSWQPTVVWVSPTAAAVQIRSMGAYTDSVTGVSHVFAGVDDTTGAGGIFSGTYNSAVPGCLTWNQTPELALSATNTGVTLPSELNLRVMSFCVGTNASGGTSLFATIGVQVWERVDGANPTWQLVWTKPTVSGEISQSGLRGLTKAGTYFLVFPEGNNWGVVLLNPAAGWSATWEYTLANLQSALGSGFTVNYVTGCYDRMGSVEINSTWYGLIGLGIQVSAYPAGTLIYSPASGGGTWLAQSHYLTRKGTGAIEFQLCQMAQQTNPTESVRFMVPLGTTYVMAGGFDFEGDTEAAEYGWGAYDTQANAVSGTT